MAGEVMVNYYGAGQVATMVRAGRLGALAVTGDKPLPYLPGVPGFKQLGIDLEAPTWYGLFASAGTPREIVQRLNRETVRITSNPQFAEKFQTSRGITPAGDISPEEFAAFVKKDRENFAERVKSIGLKTE